MPNLLSTDDCTFRNSLSFVCLWLRRLFVLHQTFDFLRTILSTTTTHRSHPKNVYAFQQNIFTARVVHGQAPEAKDVVQQTMRDDESGRERLAENNRRKRRRDEEISVERSPTGGYSRHVWLCRRGGKDYIYACTFYAASFSVHLPNSFRPFVIVAFIRVRLKSSERASERNSYRGSSP